VTRIVRRAARLSVAASTVALSIAFGATAAAANETPASPAVPAVPAPSVSVEPQPSVTATPSPTSSPWSTEAPKPGATTPAKARPAPPAEPAPDIEPLPSVTATPTASPAATGSPATAEAAKGNVPDAARTITGRIWHDVNKNGIQETGEPGFEGLSISALGNDPIEPAAATPAAVPHGHYTARTDKNGVYVLKGITFASVRLEFGAWGYVGDELVHTRISPRHSGADPAKDSDFDEFEIKAPGQLSQYNGVIYDLALPAGETVDVDGGMFADPKWVTSKTITVKGRVWNDRNRNGIQDQGEPGIQGIPVFAVSSNEVVPDERLHKPAPARPGVNRLAVPDPTGREGVTNADGTYHFRALGEGTVHVGVASGPINETGVPALVWKYSVKGAGTDRAKDSDVATVDGPTPNMAHSGDLRARPNTTLVVDAGLFKTATASPTATATATPAPGTGGSLPNTGVTIGGFLAAGAALIGAGAALTVVARRRREIAA